MCKKYVIRKNKMKNKLQKYLSETLGLETKQTQIQKKDLNKLPFFLREMYNFRKTKLFGREIIFLYPKGNERLSVEKYSKHIRQIEETYNLPIVLIFEQLEAYNRKRLIEKQVAFIIPEKQMFIPQVLIDLREFRNTVSKKSKTIMPAAQYILFYHLLKENVGTMNFKMLAQKLNYSQMTITRAAYDLADKKICGIEGGKEKRLIFDEDKREIWKKALPFLQNPVKKKIFTTEIFDENLMYKAGYSALAFYADINANEEECFAIANTDYLRLAKKRRKKKIKTTESPFCVEIWKYSPGILFENRTVDPLSLYLTLKEENDERVELELEKALERLW